MTGVDRMILPAAALACCWALGGAPAWAVGLADCQALATPGLFKDTSITKAQLNAATATVPENCEVEGVVKPTPGSNIGVEFRLPTAWNGKFLGLGGGGFGGSISNNGFTDAIQRGYAAAQTNIGHTPADGAGGSWALDAPGDPDEDKVTDFAYRSVLYMTTVGKAVVKEYYKQRPDLSYWQGCSTGGRQGLILAQRYPWLYDGMVAGAPVYTMRLQLGTVWRRNVFHAQPGTALTEPLLAVINNAVLAACDAKDGVTDGVLEDPRQCKWDPSAIVCPGGGEGADCLSTLQADAVRHLYAGTITDRGKLLYPGVTRGGELDWVSRYIQDAINTGIGPETARYMVFLDPNYDIETFDINDPNTVRKWDAAPVSVEGNGDDPDIGHFIRRGGKLLMYHGYNDAGPSPLSTIQYYERVEKVFAREHDDGDRRFRKNGRRSSAERLRDSVRLFMAPGMYHCGGGPGWNNFDELTALERWVEQGIAPDSILASNTARGIERPLCPYPQVARYIGTGDANVAANFKCVTPRRSGHRDHDDDDDRGGGRDDDDERGRD